MPCPTVDAASSGLLRLWHNEQRCSSCSSPKCPGVFENHDQKVSQRIAPATRRRQPQRQQCSVKESIEQQPRQFVARSELQKQRVGECRGTNIEASFA